MFEYNFSFYLKGKKKYPKQSDCASILMLADVICHMMSYQIFEQIANIKDYRAR